MVEKSKQSGKHFSEKNNEDIIEIGSGNLYVLKKMRLSYSHRMSGNWGPNHKFTRIFLISNILIVCIYYSNLHRQPISNPLPAHPTEGRTKDNRL